ncbi:hypothetical protein [Streptomyces sp. ST2-7A]|uniref:hypothetical protein n=1 Tax=Streptomyces sp. ST2-7A TaxID=2907214 RepID=UPI001F479053|nr:hypothetical protein [Streptomyces sp. ST2-7A]MCE7081624.1 hypothetical protein [Streptomyces sp. ST2-7A]
MANEVTRIEIADHLSEAFRSGAASRDELLLAAAEARPEVRLVLQRLPERHYTDMRQLWEELPAIPVEL